jgi:hypothetical protein
MFGALLSQDVSIGNLHNRKTIYTTQGDVIMEFTAYNKISDLIPDSFIAGLGELLNIPAALAQVAESSLVQPVRTQIHLVCNPAKYELPTVRTFVALRRMALTSCNSMGVEELKKGRG